MQQLLVSATFSEEKEGAGVGEVYSSPEYFGHLVVGEVPCSSLWQLVVAAGAHHLLAMDEGCVAHSTKIWVKKPPKSS